MESIGSLKNSIPGIYENALRKVALTDTERQQLAQAIELLDQGQIRICEYQNGHWQTQAWVKMAIIAYIYDKEPELYPYGLTYRDHTPYKYDAYPIPEHTRVVPGGYIRKGAYIGKHTVIMPSFINMGAYIDDGCMIDTYASIGSGAQIGKNVHISAGTGIGGVLEPLQANPTIIEDNCFIGARCELSEGVLVKQGAVLASGLFISGSTRIYNRLTQEITFGVVPENAVVVPGSLPAKDQSHHLNCAVIVKFADEATRKKTAINQLLRYSE